MTAFALCTHSGAMINLLAPDAALIRIEDVARHLSAINRFCGATELPVSVAQHCLLVSRAVEAFGPRMALLGLLHDAHEYVTGDITSPVKRALAQLAGRDVVALLQANIDARIYAALNLDPPTAIEAETIARADAGALISEWRKLMKGECPVAGEPIRLAWAGMSPDRAHQAFLTRFAALQILLPGVKFP